MAKAPVPGTVKTRLRLVPEAAARLQAAFIKDAVTKARTLGPVTVAGTPPDRLGLVEPLLPEGVGLIPQVEGDLGEKMLAGTRTLFAESPEPLLLLGTDAPTLPLDRIREAAHALEKHDASLVPSTDGGYVLLGLSGPHEALFAGVEWSTEAVCAQTLERAAASGLSVWRLEPWYDVDTPADLVRLAGELAVFPNAAPYTAGALDDLGA